MPLNSTNFNKISNIASSENMETLKKLQRIPLPARNIHICHPFQEFNSSFRGFLNLDTFIIKHMETIQNFTLQEIQSLFIERFFDVFQQILSQIEADLSFWDFFSWFLLWSLLTHISVTYIVGGGRICPPHGLQYVF